MLRLAESFEHADPLSQAWKRLMTPAAKFWICKRSVEFTGETMEVFGGNGYVDDGPMARLFREAPVNSIWEGSGNVMCLDLMRGIGRDPQGAFALLDALAADAAGDAPVARELAALRRMLDGPPQPLEALGRLFAQRLVLAAQATLLRRHGSTAVADAFIATRFEAPDWGRVAGGIDLGRVDADAVLARALPG